MAMPETLELVGPSVWFCENSSFRFSLRVMEDLQGGYVMTAEEVAEFKRLKAAEKAR